jgi:hypothetical protein
MSEAFVSTIINNAIATANSQTAAADAAARAASTASAGYATMSPPPIAYTLTALEPAVPEVGDATLTFEAQRDKIIALLSDQMAGFFIKYYPLASDAFDEATSWLVNSITGGGTGLSAAVEEQIWQRGRDRVVADGMRAESQTLNEFASRGFSLPSGVMAARLQQDRYMQLGKTQELSRDAAIKQADMTVENVRFAIEQAIKSRTAAMQAAADYIRSLMSGTDTAARVASINSDAKARMMGATSDLYRARLARDELALKIPLANSDLNVRAQEANIVGFYKGVDARVAAAGHAADVYGKAAQAALSSLSAVGSSAASSFG